MAERSFKEEVKTLRLGEGEVFRGEGILAVTKALLQSGVSYVAGYQGAPISHLVDVLADANDILEELGIRFEFERERGNRDRDACGLGELSLARRRHLQGAGRGQRRLGCAREPRLRRRQGRRADHRRRGLRRGLLDHAGAQPRLRHEVPGVASRPAPEPADHRAHGREGLRALGSLEHAGDARAAHPRLPRLRLVHDQGECAARLHAEGRARAPDAGRQSHRAAADDLRPREGEDRRTLAGRGEVRGRERAQRVLRRRRRRHRHRPAGRDVQRRGARLGAARPCRFVRQHPRAALRAQRHLPLDRRRVRALLRRQARAPRRGGGPARIHRAGGQHHPAPGRHPDPDRGQGPIAHGRRVHRRRGARRHPPVHREAPAGPRRRRAGERARQGPPRREPQARSRRTSTAGRPPSAPAARSARSSPR